MRNDFRGIDYVWYAIDADGHVGVFTTGGEGPVPSWIERRWSDSVFDELETLPARGRHHLVPRADIQASPVVSMDPFGDWKQWASRGFYAYDWADVHRPLAARIDRYELIAAPSDPIAVESMPEALAHQPRLDGVRFATMELVEISDSWKSSPI